MSDDRAAQAAAEAMFGNGELWSFGHGIRYADDDAMQCFCGWNANGDPDRALLMRLHVAKVAVAAAREVIEAEVLARIQASEGWHSDSWGVDCIYRDAVDRAARGGTP